MPRDFDAPWKVLLDRYLPRVLRLLCPRLERQIDWSVPYESLDGELQQLVREGELGPTRVDKLYRVRGLDGSPVVILIHVKVQSQYDAGFPERMYLYAHRLRDRYNQPVESLAILGDTVASWRPSRYEESTETSRSSFEFTSVKLLDWSERIAELEADENPVGLVVAAHLQSQATANDQASRRDWKFRLFRGLLQRLLSAEDVRQFLRLIDWLLDLPKEIDHQLRQDVYNLGKEQEMESMPMSSFELFAQEEGIEIGLARGAAKYLPMALEFRFGEAGIRYAEELKARADLGWVEKLEAHIRSAVSIDELRAAVG